MKDTTQHYYRDQPPDGSHILLHVPSQSIVHLHVPPSPRPLPTLLTAIFHLDQHTIKVPRTLEPGHTYIFRNPKAPAP
jgi:hypothetical protein